MVAVLPSGVDIAHWLMSAAAAARRTRKASLSNYVYLNLNDALSANASLQVLIYKGRKQFYASIA